MKDTSSWNDAFLWLALLSGYLAAVLIGFLGAAVAWMILIGKIDLKNLVSEGPQGGGDASLSRFQFLIFTFVVAMSILLMVVAQIKSGATSFSFPDLNNVWGLLGISGGSYVVSKGIQKNFETNVQTPRTQPNGGPARPNGGGPQQGGQTGAQRGGQSGATGNLVA